MRKQDIVTVCITCIALAVLLPPVFSKPVDQNHPGKQAGKSPVKVFILAGQSNMEGYGAIHEVDKAGDERKGTLTYLLDDPANGTLFKHLRDDRPMPVSETITIEATNSNFGDPAPNRIKKLWIEYTLDGGKQQQKVDEGETLTISAKPGQVTIEKAFYGDLPDGDKRDVTEEVKNLIKASRTRVRWKVRDDVWVWFNDRRGGLSAGFGANKNLFGPELQFGNGLGGALDNQVLIIKTAWGGKSLYKEFRPPSSGGEVGPCYLQVIETVNRILANLKIEFPGYDDGGYELSGLVWWHGWNDGCDPKNAIPEYEQNLVNLIKDLRKDLRAPKLPVVVGELTGPWVEAPDEWATLRQAQAAAAAHPEFQGNVLFVPTHDFVRKEEDSPGGWPAHEFNNAETYFLVGNALGEAIKKLLTTPQPGAKPGPSTPLSYTDRNIEGWTVRISDQLMETEREATMKAIELLTAQLSEIVWVVPAQALAVLRSVPLWISPLYPGQRQPRAEYHPDAGWLRDHGRDPAMAKAVEFTNVSIFEAETRRMPNFALHELAHAYHDRVLGYDHPEIKDAYEKAKATGRYDRVEQRFGDGRTAQSRAYAMTDPQEYFAETTEAFFSTNDFFPFTRDELKRHDPEMFDLLAKLWGTETKRNNPSAGPLRN